MEALSSQLMACRVTYFYMFAAIGVMGPFLPIIYHRKGLSGDQIGVLSAAVPLTSIPFSPLLCALADRFHARRSLLLAGIFAWAVLQCFVLATDAFALLLLLTLTIAVTRAPVTPLVDAACVAAATKSHTYGEQRLWGAVGFGIMTLAGGAVADATTGWAGLFILFCGLCAATFLAARGLVLDPGNSHPGNGHGAATLVADDEEEDGGGCSDRDVEVEVDVDVEPGVSSNRKDLEVEGESDVPFRRKVSEEIELERAVRRMSVADADTGEAAGIIELPRRHRIRPRSGSGGSGGNGSPVRTASTADAGGGIIGKIRAAGAAAAAGGGGHVHAGGHGHGQPRFAAAARLLLRDPDVLAVFAVVTLSGASAGVIDTFLFVRLDELGGSGTLLGLARAIMCAAEVPVFRVTGRWIDRWGVKSVLAAAQVAYLVRFIYYSILIHPWVVLPCEVLHGITFAALWDATTAFAHEVSPPGMHATLQGVASALHWGVGFGLGAIGGGVIYQAKGAVFAFQMGAVLATGSLLLALASIATRGPRVRPRSRGGGGGGSGGGNGGGGSGGGGSSREGSEDGDIVEDEVSNRRANGRANGGVAEYELVQKDTMKVETG